MVFFVMIVIVIVRVLLLIIMIVFGMYPFFYINSLYDFPFNCLFFNNIVNCIMLFLKMPLLLPYLLETYQTCLIIIQVFSIFLLYTSFYFIFHIPFLSLFFFLPNWFFFLKKKKKGMLGNIPQVRSMFSVPNQNMTPYFSEVSGNMQEALQARYPF